MITHQFLSIQVSVEFNAMNDIDVDLYIYVEDYFEHRISQLGFYGVVLGEIRTRVKEQDEICQS